MDDGDTVGTALVAVAVGLGGVGCLPKAERRFDALRIIAIALGKHMDKIWKKAPPKGVCIQVFDELGYGTDKHDVLQYIMCEAASDLTGRTLSYKQVAKILSRTLLCDSWESWTAAGANYATKSNLILTVSTQLWQGSFRDLVNHDFEGVTVTGPTFGSFR